MATEAKRKLAECRKHLLCNSHVTYKGCTLLKRGLWWVEVNFEILNMTLIKPEVLVSQNNRNGMNRRSLVLHITEICKYFNKVVENVEITFIY